MADPFYEAMYFFSRTFGVPMEIFRWPYVLFYFIIPLIGLIYLWYTFLDKKLRIFRSSSTANFGIAVILSFVSCPIIVVGSPFILAVAAGGSVLLREKITLRRIVIGIAVALIVGIIVQLLMAFSLRMMGLSPLA